MDKSFALDRTEGVGDNSPLPPWDWLSSLRDTLHFTPEARKHPPSTVEFPADERKPRVKERTLALAERNSGELKSSTRHQALQI